MRFWRDRRHAGLDVLTARCQTDQWRIPYQVGVQLIDAAVEEGLAWCEPFVLPDSCTPEQRREWARVLNYATGLGFERRPGGSAGHGCQWVHLERSSGVGVMG